VCSRRAVTVLRDPTTGASRTLSDEERRRAIALMNAGPP
jgi:hypothetical protein